MTESTHAAARITRVFSALTDPAARRVLVVDDEESIRLALGKFLRSRGYDVTTVNDGAAAIEALRQARFDAMLCDVRMPGMTGIAVVARALEIHPDLAILMITAVSDAPTATEAQPNRSIHPNPICSNMPPQPRQNVLDGDVTFQLACWPVVRQLVMSCHFSS